MPTLLSGQEKRPLVRKLANSRAWGYLNTFLYQVNMKKESVAAAIWETSKLTSLSHIFSKDGIKGVKS
jgi:hypothetical protein